MTTLRYLAILLIPFSAAFAQDRIINGNLKVTGGLTYEGVFHAAQYGVVADGSTDDTAALQSAIDAARTVVLASSGTNPNNLVTARVILPPGRIVINSTVTLYKGIELAGAGRTLTRLEHPSSIAAVTGTAQAGATATITLAAGASATNDFYNGRLIYLTGGTGSGQTAIIEDYDGTTKVATVYRDWDTTPDATSTYSIKRNILETAIDTTDNRQLVIRDLNIVGDGADTGAGIRINDSYFDSGIINVSITNCFDNIRINGSWTFLLDRVNANFAVQDNVNMENWTGGIATGCRFDNAGRYGFYLQRDYENNYNSVGAQFTSCYFQRSGQSGFYGRAISTLSFFGAYFEDNNRDDGGYPDVRLLDTDTKGSSFGFYGCYASTSGSDETGTLTQFLNVDDADSVILFGCTIYDGTDQIYDYGVETASLVENLTLVGNGALNGQTGEINSHANTNVHWIGNNTAEFYVYSGEGAPTFEGQGNMAFAVDAPADRRAEFSVSTAGTHDWYWGRGDSDESLPGDFYIDRTSGGGGEPDVVIDETSGFVGLSVLDPTSILDVKNNDIRIRTSQTPSSTSATGWTGEICWDSDYIYVCVTGDGPGGSTDSWKRVAISTW